MTKTEMKAFTEALVKVRTLLSDAQAVEVAALYPTWQENTEYSFGTRILYDNKLYKVAESHTSTKDKAPNQAANLFIEL